MHRVVVVAFFSGGFRGRGGQPSDPVEVLPQEKAAADFIERCAFFEINNTCTSFHDGIFS